LVLSGLVIAPARANVTLSSLPPTIAQTAGVFVTPPAGGLALAPSVPILTGNINRVAQSAEMALAGHAPVTSLGAGIRPSAGQLLLVESAPTVVRTVGLFAEAFGGQFVAQIKPPPELIGRQSPPPGFIGRMP
jgi:hypothetical protein